VRPRECAKHKTLWRQPRLRTRGRRAHDAPVVGRQVAVGQPCDSLAVPLIVAGRHDDRIRQYVVHIGSTGGARVSKVAHLHGRGAMCEYPQARSLGQPHQIDGNVDAAGAQQAGYLPIAHPDRVDAPIEPCKHASFELTRSHLARHRAADLFIDTLPCNAHTTASDALWAGLPVLTCPGESFASRVAASLLTAIELRELIASTPEHYEQIAIRLATCPQVMSDIRERLSAKRLTAPLFDTPLYCRHLESAFTDIYEEYLADARPQHLFVESGSLE